MKLTLLNIGKTDTTCMREGINDYSKRINHFIDFSVVDLAVKKVSKKESPQQLLKREGEILEKALKKSQIIVLLDEKGREYSSRDFAGWLEKMMNQGVKQISFVTGGAYGFSKDLYKVADYKFSLSKMTFTHQMVRLLFAEQLYRAFTIIKGIPYHND